MVVDMYVKNGCEQKRRSNGAALRGNITISRQKMVGRAIYRDRVVFPRFTYKYIERRCGW